MNTTHRFSFFLLAVGLLTVGSCVNDALPEPVVEGCDAESFTYTDDVRLIIEETCAYAACHLGNAPGFYDDYDGLLSALNSGSFRDRVITRAADPNAGMPPDYAPVDRARDLTEEQLNIIECWLEQGFPE